MTRPALELSDPPTLRPLPILPRGARSAHPQVVWTEYWALDKQPLMVTATLDRTVLPTEAHHLDAILSAAQLRAADDAWLFGEGGPKVIPLPLTLLDAVTVDNGNRNAKRWPTLPLWASTPLIQQRPGQAQAICIGHADTVRELLNYIHTIGKDAALVGVKWQVVPLPISDSEAREIISEQRPMPGRAERWTPPYWYDWTSRQAARASGTAQE